MQRAALQLLKLKPNDPLFANRILRFCKDLDSGAKLHWAQLEPGDRDVAKAFRNLLKELQLFEVEKKVLASGNKVAMAFIKSESDDRSDILYNILKPALTQAFEELCKEQVADLVQLMERARAEEAEEAPVLVEPETERKSSSSSDEEEERPRGGLMSLQEYRERGVSALTSTAPRLTEEQPSVNLLDRSTAPDKAALKKYHEAKRLNEELWGLSSRKQARLREKLGD